MKETFELLEEQKRKVSSLGELVSKYQKKFENNELEAQKQVKEDKDYNKELRNINIQLLAQHKADVAQRKTNVKNTNQLQTMLFEAQR